MAVLSLDDNLINIDKNHYSTSNLVLMIRLQHTIMNLIYHIVIQKLKYNCCIN